MFNWLDLEAASGYINCIVLPRVVRAGGCLTVDQPKARAWPVEKAACIEC